MEVSLQDIGMGGWAGVSEDTGGGGDSGGNTGIVSSLENIGINLGAAAATVGLQSFAKSQGVSAAYANPAAIAYNSSALTSRPGTFSPVGAAIGGVSGNTLIVAGLIIAGLFAIASFSRRASS